MIRCLYGHRTTHTVLVTHSLNSTTLLSMLSDVKQMDCLNMTVKQETARPICVGCNLPIADQYVMKILPDMSWHPDCLKCSECHRYLDDTCTCFFREGRVYCKPDYQRYVIRPYATFNTTAAQLTDRHTYHPVSADSTVIGQSQRKITC